MFGVTKTKSLMDKTKDLMNMVMRAQGIDIETDSSENDFKFLDKIESNIGFNFNIPQTLDGSEESNQVQKKIPAKKELKQCTFELLWRGPSENEQEFFLYGGFCLNFKFNREPDSALVRIGRPISHSVYFPKEGLLLMYYSSFLVTEKNMMPIIQRSLSVGDVKYKQLADALTKYQIQIYEFINVRENFAKSLYSKQLLDDYDMLYQQFEDWAISEVRKMDVNQKIFAFSIYKFNLRTHEFELHVSGQSKGMMILRGYDMEDMNSRFFRERFHYMDGESNLNLLIKQLDSLPKGKETRQTKVHMVTFDGLKLEVEHSCQNFTNRDESYPYRDLQIQNSPLKFEFLIGMAFTEITTSTLHQLISIRSARDELESIQFEDFSYSMEAQIFLEKYYQNHLDSSEIETA